MRCREPLNSRKNVPDRTNPELENGLPMMCAPASGQPCFLEIRKRTCTSISLVCQTTPLFALTLRCFFKPDTQIGILVHWSSAVSMGSKVCVCVALVDSVIVGPQSVENAARLARVARVANR